jgi:zinc D-Ala-D-Ala carboxypeptidase
MNISEHITYDEAVYSSTAIKNGIENIPNSEQLSAMKLTAEKVFEPLRKGLGGNPIHIDSFFRSKELNVKIGGASNSQHMTGEAMDIVYSGGNKNMFNYIVNNLEYDQVIWEFGDENNPAWVHVSYSKTHNRKQKLQASKVNGQTVYKNFTN